MSARGLERLNGLVPADAEAALRACCASAAWARRMAERRPFASPDALHQAADDVWWSLDRADWLEAFAGHPRIGERAGGHPSAEASRWSAQEQSGTATATADTRAALAEGNRAYEALFGHVYLVCATGKSADEMLALLRARLHNDPATELRVAAAEQAKITHLRLERLLDQ